MISLSAITSSTSESGLSSSLLLANSSQDCPSLPSVSAHSSTAQSGPSSSHQDSSRMSAVTSAAQSALAGLSATLSFGNNGNSSTTQSHKGTKRSADQANLSEGPPIYPKKHKSLASDPSLAPVSMSINRSRASNSRFSTPFSPPHIPQDSSPTFSAGISMSSSSPFAPLYSSSNPFFTRRSSSSSPALLEIRVKSLLTPPEKRISDCVQVIRALQEDPYYLFLVGSPQGWKTTKRIIYNHLKTGTTPPEKMLKMIKALTESHIQSSFLDESFVESEQFSQAYIQQGLPKPEPIWVEIFSPHSVKALVQNMLLDLERNSASTQTNTLAEETDLIANFFSSLMITSSPSSSAPIPPLQMNNSSSEQTLEALRNGLKQRIQDCENIINKNLIADKYHIKRILLLFLQSHIPTKEKAIRMIEEYPKDRETYGHLYENEKSCFQSFCLSKSVSQSEYNLRRYLLDLHADFQRSLKEKGFDESRATQAAQDFFEEFLPQDSSIRKFFHF